MESQELSYDDLKIITHNEGDSLSLHSINKIGNLLLKSGEEGNIKIIGGKNKDTNNGIYLESKGSQVFFSEKESLFFLSGKQKESIVFKSTEINSEIKFFQGNENKFILNQDGIFFENNNKYSKISLKNYEGDINIRTYEFGKINIESTNDLNISSEKGKISLFQKNKKDTLQITSNGLLKIIGNNQTSFHINNGLDFKISGEKMFGDVIFDFLEDGIDFKIKMRGHGNIIFDNLNNFETNAKKTVVNSKKINIENEYLNINSKKFFLKNNEKFQVNNNILLEDSIFGISNLDIFSVVSKNINLILSEEEEAGKLFLHNNTKNGLISIKNKGINGNINIESINEINLIGSNNSNVKINKDSNILINSYQNLEVETVHGNIIYNTIHGEKFIVDFSKNINSVIHLNSSKRNGKILLEGSNIQNNSDNFFINIWDSFNVLPGQESSNILLKSGKKSNIRLISGQNTLFKSDGSIELHSEKIEHFAKEVIRFNLDDDLTSFEIGSNNEINKYIVKINNESINFNIGSVNILNKYLFKNDELKIDIPNIDINFIKINDKKKYFKIVDPKASIEFNVDNIFFGGRDKFKIKGSKKVELSGDEININSLHFYDKKIEVGDNEIEQLVFVSDKLISKNKRIDFFGENIFFKQSIDGVNQYEFSINGENGMIFKRDNSQEIFHVEDNLIETLIGEYYFKIDKQNISLGKKNNSLINCNQKELNIFHQDQIIIGNKKNSKIELENNQVKIMNNEKIEISLDDGCKILMENSINKKKNSLKLWSRDKMDFEVQNGEIFLGSTETISSKIYGNKITNQILSEFILNRDVSKIRAKQVDIMGKQIGIGTSKTKMEMGDDGFRILTNVTLGNVTLENNKLETNILETTDIHHFYKDILSYNSNEDRLIYNLNKVDFLFNEKMKFKMEEESGFFFEIGLNRKFFVGEEENGFFLFDNDTGFICEHQKFMKFVTNGILKLETGEGEIMLKNGINLKSEKRSINLNSKQINLKMENGTIEGKRGKIEFGESDGDAFNIAVLGNSIFKSNKINLRTDELTIFDNSKTNKFFSISDNKNGGADFNFNLYSNSLFKINSNKIEINSKDSLEQIDNKFFFVKDNFFVKHDYYYFGNYEDKFKIETNKRYKDILIKSYELSDINIKSGKNIILENENVGIYVNSTNETVPGILIKSKNSLSKFGINIKGEIDIKSQDGISLYSSVKDVFIRGKKGSIVIDNSANNINMMTENGIILKSINDKIYLVANDGIKMESNGSNSDIEISSNGRESDILLNSESNIGLRSYKNIILRGDKELLFTSEGEIDIESKDGMRISNSKSGAIFLKEGMEITCYDNIMRITQESLSSPLIISSQANTIINSEKNIEIQSRGDIILDNSSSLINFNSKMLKINTEDDILISGEKLQLKIGETDVALSDKMDIYTSGVEFNLKEKGIFKVTGGDTVLKSSSSLLFNCECENIIDGGIKLNCLYNEKNDSIDIHSQNGGIKLRVESDNFIYLSSRVSIGNVKIIDKGDLLNIESSVETKSLLCKELSLDNSSLRSTSNGIRIDSSLINCSNELSVPVLNIKKMIKVSGEIKVEGSFKYQDKIHLEKGTVFNGGSVGTLQERNFLKAEVNEKSIWTKGIFINMDSSNDKELLKNKRVGIYIKNSEINDLGLFVEGSAQIASLDSDNIKIKQKNDILIKGKESDFDEWLRKYEVKNGEGENVLCKEGNIEENINVKEMLLNLFAIVKKQDEIIKSILS